MKKRLSKILIVILYTAVVCILYFAGIGCIWKRIFGIPCPGCGFSRAVVSSLRFDFAGAFSYHPMFWSFPILGFYFIFEDKIKSRFLDYLLLFIILGFGVTWIVRLILHQTV